MPPAVAAVVAFAGTAIGKGVIVGAVIGGITSAIKGDNILKGAALGGLIGGATAGIGSALSGGAGGTVGGGAGGATASGSNLVTTGLLTPATEASSAGIVGSITTPATQATTSSLVGQGTGAMASGSAPSAAASSAGRASYGVLASDAGPSIAQEGIVTKGSGGLLDGGINNAMNTGAKELGDQATKGWLQGIIGDLSPEAQAAVLGQGIQGIGGALTASSQQKAAEKAAEVQYERFRSRVQPELANVPRMPVISSVRSIRNA